MMMLVVITMMVMVIRDHNNVNGDVIVVVANEVTRQELLHIPISISSDSTASNWRSAADRWCNCLVIVSLTPLTKWNPRSGWYERTCGIIVS